MTQPITPAGEASAAVDAVSATAPAVAAITAASPSPSQATLFHRRVLTEYPPTRQTADALGEVEADDLHRYYIKDDHNGRSTRASEWLGSKLCETVGFAAPTPMILQRLNGDLVFGSRRIIGAADAAETQAILKSPTLSNSGPGAPGLTMFLSGLYAFDMFLFNVDRHFGNYLSIDDGGTRRFYAFDFGHGVFSTWPWSDYPAPHEWTRRRGVTARQLHGWNEAAALTTLERLGAVASGTLEGFFREMPSDWLARSLQDEFLEWWSSSKCSDRVTELRKGITDGSLL